MQYCLDRVWDFKIVLILLCLALVIEARVMEFRLRIRIPGSSSIYSSPSKNNFLGTLGCSGTTSAILFNFRPLSDTVYLTPVTKLLEIEKLTKSLELLYIVRKSKKSM